MDIGLSIIELNENIDILTIDAIKEKFTINNVYFEKEFMFKIPNKKGTFEIQYYSLLNDLWFYFEPNINKNKNFELKQLFKVFCYLAPAFEDIPNMTDEHAICIFNYLINILYIYKDSEIIDVITFNDIILSCLTFNKDIAKKNLKK